jgi:hypothetical protein
MVKADCQCVWTARLRELNFGFGNGLEYRKAHPWSINSLPKEQTAEINLNVSNSTSMPSIPSSIKLNNSRIFSITLQDRTKCNLKVSLLIAKGNRAKEVIHQL